ncbi:SPP1 family predicted phage head-tail adaptor [Silvibacterium bohemicum]|uniref:SPP1 family predicted phage head-tail adaptor n=1 Tax=Silvibacterium bohemicum TaxID=1577686 RepID=A0A841JU90_9BACT|nr:phage head closure protein [Silvibacterium bohemicum]MBB6144720.1 SPP1 family predicted phage head-tail adaptor [Silvibacterium bohemicum]
MIAGKLNRRIQIQQQATTQDSLGQPQQTWTTIYTCWAEIDFQRSQLLYETSAFVSKVTHRITIRWTSSVVIQPQMRIVYTEATTGVMHVYNIEALLNTNQRNRELIAICYELDAAE